MTKREIRMPLMGDMISEGTLLRWLRAVGDVVKEGDPLFEVATEKVETEVVSPVSGRLTALLVGAGDTVAIGTVIAVADEDLEEHAHATPAPVEVAISETQSDRSAERVDGGRFVEFTPMRKVIGQRLTRSLSNAAHTLAIMEVDYENIERARERARLFGTPVTYLPFVGRAVCDAIVDYPLVNAHVGADGLDVFEQVHLGIAVDVEAIGLVVPVVREAGTLRIMGLAAAIQAVSLRVRSGELTRELLEGGTFTLTNPGGTGNLAGRPIINPPQAAILETDAVRQMVVPMTDSTGEIAIRVRRRGNLSLSYDHRAFDGLYACSFLRRVVDILSDRSWVAEFGT